MNLRNSNKLWETDKGRQVTENNKLKVHDNETDRTLSVTP